jgi:tight adherence protein B
MSLLNLIGLALLLAGVAYLVISTALPVSIEKRRDPYAAHTGGQAPAGTYRSFLEIPMGLLPKRVVQAYRRPLDVGRIFNWSAFLDRQFALLLLGLGGGLMAFGTPLLVVIAALVPPFVHYQLRRKKAREYESRFLLQLPNALLLVASAMSAGRNFVNALEATAPNLADPLRSELVALARQIQSMRVTEAEAFRLWADRLPYPELATAAAALAIGNRVGLEVSVLLRNLSDSIQAEIRARQELIAVTSQVRSTATVISFLPFAFLLFIYLITPGFVLPLLTTVAGVIVLLVVVAMNQGSRIITRRLLESIEL